MVVFADGQGGGVAVDPAADGREGDVRVLVADVSRAQPRVEPGEGGRHPRRLADQIHSGEPNESIRQQCTRSSALLPPFINSPTRTKFI